MPKRFQGRPAIITEERHPAYGSAVLALLRLPITRPADGVRRLAHGLTEPK
jgi:hypothetical protein